MEDSHAALRGLSSLKTPLHISFVNAAGMEEAGLDYGGLLKEFLEEVGRASHQLPAFYRKCLSSFSCQPWMKFLGASCWHVGPCMP